MSRDHITILHLSDIQFGVNHRFGVEEEVGTLLGRLTKDLESLTKKHPQLTPDLIVLTGDLAEKGKKTEFEQVFQFLDGLTQALKLGRDRVTLVPGNHDINRRLCENYFTNCEEEGTNPAAPYWPKWRFFKEFSDGFYIDLPPRFTAECPYTLFEMPDLNLVVAGLNSTLKESHRDEDHFGHVGEEQLKWFRDELERFKKQGWLRIGALHHNQQRGAVDDEENLRDADDLERILGDSLNLLLHGHTHKAKLAWLTQHCPILATGSTALKQQARPGEHPNQYQFIQLFPDKVIRTGRAFLPDQKCWQWDNRIHSDGQSPFDTHAVHFEGVSATFPDHQDKESKQRPERGDERERKELFDRAGRRDDFLTQVEEVCRKRRADGEVTTARIAMPHPLRDYLRVTQVEDGITHVFPVLAVDGRLTEEVVREVVDGVVAKYRALDPGIRPVLVYGGQADDDALRLAGQARIQAVSFAEYQGLLKFDDYLRHQSRQLWNRTRSIRPPSTSPSGSTATGARPTNTPPWSR